MPKRTTSTPYRPRADARSPDRYYFREWRLYRKLTQERAAERAQLSVATISQLENGEQGISDRALAALSHAYDCEIGDLFRHPNRPDDELIKLVKGLKEDEKEQAIRVLKALGGRAA